MAHTGDGGAAHQAAAWPSRCACVGSEDADMTMRNCCRTDRRVRRCCHPAPEISLTHAKPQHLASGAGSSGRAIVAVPPDEPSPLPNRLLWRRRLLRSLVVVVFRHLPLPAVPHVRCRLRNAQRAAAPPVQRGPGASPQMILAVCGGMRRLCARTPSLLWPWPSPRPPPSQQALRCAYCAPRSPSSPRPFAASPGGVQANRSS